MLVAKERINFILLMGIKIVISEQLFTSGLLLKQCYPKLLILAKKDYTFDKKIMGYLISSFKPFASYLPFNRSKELFLTIILYVAKIILDLLRRNYHFSKRDVTSINKVVKKLLLISKIGIKSIFLSSQIQNN